MTIEEAFQPFADAERRIGFVRARKAARAVALAVLEETLDTVARTGELLDYYHLRKRIEELGR